MMPDTFWNLTPAEFAEIVDGYVRVRQAKAKERARDIISLAWYTEALARTKKLPDLDDLLKKLDDTNKPKQKAQTSEQMMTMCKLLNAAYGGTVVET